jgi:hypothetical protein
MPVFAAFQASMAVILEAPLFSFPDVKECPEKLHGAAQIT